MKKFCALILITCVTTFLSSRLLADGGFMTVVNYVGLPLYVETTSDKYCLDKVEPDPATVMPGKSLKFNIVTYNGFFSSCGWEHSSQVFKVYTKKHKGKNYYGEVEWYKKPGIFKLGHVHTVSSHGLHFNAYKREWEKTNSYVEVTKIKL